MKGEKQKVCVICEEKKKSKSKKIIQEKKKVCVICPAATWSIIDSVGRLGTLLAIYILYKYRIFPNNIQKDALTLMVIIIGNIYIVQVSHIS